MIHTSSKHRLLELAPNAAQLDDALAVLRELRGHRTLAELRALFYEGYEHSGYRLAALVVEDTIVAVAGFRVLTNSAVGRHLYIDDLVTRAGSRRLGYGAELLEHLLQCARKASCSCLMLDSGKQRTNAHRFYEREGLVPTDLHFRIALRER